MEHKEAIALAKELRKKITRYSASCETINIADYGRHSNIEVYPQKGTDTISNIKEISEFVNFFNLNSYICIRNGKPCLSIF